MNNTCWQKANTIVQINQEKNVYVNSPKWEFYLVTNHILYSLLNFCWKGTPSLSLKQRTARVPHMCKDLMTPTTRWMQLARSASLPCVHSMRQKTIFSGLYEPPIMPCRKMHIPFYVGTCLPIKILVVFPGNISLPPQFFLLRLVWFFFHPFS